MVYGTSAIKRQRRTAAQIEEICAALIEVLEQDNPQSVRHVYYRLSDSPYYLVAALLADMLAREGLAHG